MRRLSLTSKAKPIPVADSAALDAGVPSFYRARSSGVCPRCPRSSLPHPAQAVSVPRCWSSPAVGRCRC